MASCGDSSAMRATNDEISTFSERSPICGAPSASTIQRSAGSQWLHEIKHDGFRVIARKDGERVRLYSRPGNELTRRFPLIVETLARLLKMKNPAAPAVKREDEEDWS